MQPSQKGGGGRARERERERERKTNRCGRNHHASHKNNVVYMPRDFDRFAL